MKWRILVWACRLILGGVFIYASLDKIAHPERFAELVYNYRILPGDLVNLFAIVLPWVELTGGLLLLTGRQPLPASLILTGLMVVFGSAIGYNLARGLDFNCGCFSTSPEMAKETIRTLARDVALLVPAAVCLFDGHRRTSSRPQSASPIRVPDRPE
ncbi:MAG: DoxX family membrane protein [Proteobacteria bacterium]|nr:DoxX family membrane protein [Pseudomonadota bacterium]